MISKIVLNGVASYKKEAVLETDKKVNLLYGLNGTGKSTFSEFLYEQSGARFSQCRIEGLEDNDTILVYNKKFVHDIFYEPQGIHGIFTLSKRNAEAQKAIDNANAEVKKLTEQKRKIEEKRAKDRQKHLGEIEEYKKQVWKIKTEYAGGDAVSGGFKKRRCHHLVDSASDGCHGFAGRCILGDCRGRNADDSR